MSTPPVRYTLRDETTRDPILPGQSWATFEAALAAQAEWMIAHPTRIAQVMTEPEPQGQLTMDGLW